MGFALSWIAITNKTVPIVHDQLQVEATGRIGETCDASICGAATSSNWYVVVANRFYHRFVQDRCLKKLSQNCELVTCSVEEHVMASWATNWVNGKQVWSLSHFAEEGHEALEIVGTPPDFLADLRRSQSSGFEIPVEAAFNCTAFRHDRFQELQYEELRSLRISMLERVSSLIDTLLFRVSSKR